MKEITSVNNELIKDTAKLKEKKYRNQTGLFLVEGYHLIEMAKDYLQTVFVSKKNDYGIIKGVDYILVNEDIINKLAQTINPQGIIGICKQKEDMNISSNTVIMFDNIQDPGNAGTLIRSALAFGYKDIILSEDSVDIYNDKVIRSSQGGIFKVNLIYRSLESEIKNLRNMGYHIYGTALNNATPMRKITFNKKNVIILGNEGNGIRDNILKLTDENIFLEMNKDIDSLNVGVAGSIIMYELAKNN